MEVPHAGTALATTLLLACLSLAGATRSPPALKASPRRYRRRSRLP